MGIKRKIVAMAQKVLQMLINTTSMLAIGHFFQIIHALKI